MANTHDIGDVVRLSATFTQASTPVVPSTITLEVRDPNGTLVTYDEVEVVEDTPGSYHVDLPVTLAGRHLYRWVSTGNGAAAEEGYFDVRPTQIDGA